MAPPLTLTTAHWIVNVPLPPSPCSCNLNGSVTVVVSAITSEPTSSFPSTHHFGAAGGSSVLISSPGLPVIVTDSVAPNGNDPEPRPLISDFSVSSGWPSSFAGSCLLPVPLTTSLSVDAAAL